MDTAYRESSWLPPLSFPITPHASLAPVFAASPDNARRTDPVLRVFIMHNDSNRRSPATPAHLEDAGTILSVSECSFFWMFHKGGFCVFISHSKLELPDPMSRFEHCCHHVPAIGCNCQWKQHQPHHRSRRGVGEPPWGGEDVVFSVQAIFPLSLSGRNNSVIISARFIYGNGKRQLSALFICGCGWNWGNFIAIVLLNKILKYKYLPVCPSAPPMAWTCMGVLFLSEVLTKWRQPLWGLGEQTSWGKGRSK